MPAVQPATPLSARPFQPTGSRASVVEVINKASILTSKFDWFTSDAFPLTGSICSTMLFCGENTTSPTLEPIVPGTPYVNVTGVSAWPMAVGVSAV